MGIHNYYECTNIGLHVKPVSLSAFEPERRPRGSREASGVGYEGGRDGIAAFQHSRLISETAAPQ